MKKIIIFFSLFFLAACFFNFDRQVTSTTFHNFCKNNITINIKKEEQTRSITIQPLKNIFFNGSNKDDRFSYTLNGIEHSFFLYPNSSEYNKVYIACPENNQIIK